jgi:hypothetical protein
MPIGLNSSLYIFILRLLKKGQDFLGKSFIFLASLFSPELNRQPNFKFNMDLDVPFIFRLIQCAPGFLGYIDNFQAAPTSRFFTANSSAHSPIEHKSACFLVPFDRRALHCVACQIWGWVVYLSSEKKVILSKIMHLNFPNFQIFDRISKFFKMVLGGEHVLQI